MRGASPIKILLAIGKVIDIIDWVINL